MAPAWQPRLTSAALPRDPPSLHLPHLVPLDFCRCLSPLPTPGTFSLIFPFSFPFQKFTLTPLVPSSLPGQFQLGMLPPSSLDSLCQYHSSGPVVFSIALGPLAMYISWLPSYSVNFRMRVPLNYILLADFILSCLSFLPFIWRHIPILVGWH